MEELKKFIAENKVITFAAAKTRPELVREVQDKLTALGVLDPVIKGSTTTPFAPEPSHDDVPDKETLAAVEHFGQIAGIPILGTVPIELVKKLIKVTPEKFLPLNLKETDNDTDQARLAKRLVQFLISKGYWVARSPQMINIVYLEGANADGRKNKDLDDEWNDRRILLRFTAKGVPEIVLNAEATTEPNKAYAASLKAKKRGGAARIGFGQYKAWKMGFHLTAKYGLTHPCLKQFSPVRLHRDLDANGSRLGDKISVETAGINQHSTRAGQTFQRVGGWSEGCLVGRHWAEHEDFLKFLQKDIRYVQNKDYVFMTAVLNGDEFSDAMMGTAGQPA